MGFQGPIKQGCSKARSLAAKIFVKLVSIFLQETWNKISISNLSQCLECQVIIDQAKFKLNAGGI